MGVVPPNLSLTSLLCQKRGLKAERSNEITLSKYIMMVWWQISQILHLFRPTRSMMDNSFQLVIECSSWLVSVLKKVWFKFPLTILVSGVFINIFLAVTFFTLLTAWHGGKTATVRLCIGLKEVQKYYVCRRLMESLNIKEQAGQLVDSPQCSSLHQLLSPLE